MPTDKQVEAAAEAMCASTGENWNALSVLETHAGNQPDEMRDGWRDLARAALAAAEAAEPVQGVKVRALEWERGVVDWARPMPGMKYVACSQAISAIGDEWSWWLDGDESTRQVCGSELSAKAAAQADYERRIMSALAFPTPPALTTEGE